MSASRIAVQCVRYARHGHAAAPGVLELQTVSLDAGALRAGQALVKMLAAPITPTDLSAIAGFGAKPSSASASSAAFPRVAGNEGVGIVEAVGPGVTGLKKGDYVVASAPGMGTWSTHVLSDADGWTSLSGAAAPGSAALAAEVAATAVVAPLLAQQLLAGAARGSTLVQNCALSTVGQAVVQYAAAKGVKTVNILRKHADWENRVYHLQGLGAGLVLDEDFASATPKFARLLADLPPAATGLNATGGAAASSVLRALAPGGTLITYGCMSGQALRADVGAFTLRGLTLRGASLHAALAAMPKAARDAAVRGAVADVTGGAAAPVRLLLAREPFADFSHALARALRAGERKVVLTMA